MTQVQREIATAKTIRIETTINTGTNALLNALCAWLIHRGAHAVPTGFFDVLIDTFITCNCICVLTTLFNAAAARRYTRAGLYIPGGYPAPEFVSDLPGQPLLLALCLAGCAAFFLVPLLGFLLLALGVAQLPLWAYVLYKGLWGGALGGAASYVAQRRYAAKGLWRGAAKP